MVGSAYWSGIMAFIQFSCPKAWFLLTKSAWAPIPDHSGLAQLILPSRNDKAGEEIIKWQGLVIWGHMQAADEPGEMGADISGLQQLWLSAVVL